MRNRQMNNRKHEYSELEGMIEEEAIHFTIAKVKEAIRETRATIISVERTLDLLSTKQTSPLSRQSTTRLD
jgi:hypothetical protein